MQKKIDKLNKEENDEYDIAGYHMIAVSTPNSGIDSFQGESPKVAKVLHKETEMYTMRENIRRSSREMILVYLITIFEEFLSNVLKNLFMKRPEILKSSEKKVSYQEAFQCKTLNELLKHISEKEVKDLIGYDIEEFGKYLSKTHHLDLELFPSKNFSIGVMLLYTIMVFLTLNIYLKQDTKETKMHGWKPTNDIWTMHLGFLKNILLE